MMRIGTGVRVVAALTGVLLVTAGCSATDGGGAPTLAWGSCPPPAAGTTTAPVVVDPGQQCAKITVPVDYSHPGADTLQLTVSRLQTSTPGEHLGDLIIGQGGPGEPGLDLPSEALTTLPAAVRDHFDLYGLDYRGMAGSSPIRCGIDESDRQALVGVPYPAPDGDITADIARAHRIADACLQHGGTVLPHVTTANIARDIDRFRTALGDDKISYTGVSYGTYVGAVYVSLFPDHADRVLLNSVDPPGGVRDGIENKGLAVDQAFPWFARWAAERDGDYHLGSTADEVRSTTLATSSALNTTPLTVGDHTLTGNALLLGVQSLLEQPRYFPLMAGLISGAATRNLPAAALSGLPVARVFPDNFVSSQDAVLCGDTAWPADPAQYAAAVTGNLRRYPLTGGSPVDIWPCAFWSKPLEPAVTISSTGPAKVLLVNNTGDPSTAYAGAQAMRAALGSRSALITVEGVGHGVPITGDCVGRTVENYFLSGALPPDTHCG
ncbi:alpha/beta hydrolase [Nocardia sp. NPDC006630]|uniref:alpha/beta hydrolase n=1 Tax=Nocardia sp. NPDC006630 TaxID=3157181 RepID=UPI0033B400B6